MAEQCGGCESKEYNNEEALKKISSINFSDESQNTQNFPQIKQDFNESKTKMIAPPC